MKTNSRAHPERRDRDHAFGPFFSGKMLGLGHFRQMFCQPLEGLVPTLNGSVLLDHVVALRGVGESHPHRDFGLLPLFVESDGRLMTDRLALGIGLVLEDQPLGPIDFEIHDPVVIVPAVRAVHHQSPDAAGPHVHLPNRDRETLGSPPMATCSDR